MLATIRSGRASTSKAAPYSAKILCKVEVYIIKQIYFKYIFIILKSIIEQIRDCFVSSFSAQETNAMITNVLKQSNATNCYQVS